MICRLCLENLDEDFAFALFCTNDGNQAETELAKMVSKYFYLELSSDDPISMHLCQDCCEQLESWHKFWIQVDRKQSRLRANEFLEIKCEVSPNDLDNENDNACDRGEIEEDLLDLKHVPVVDEAVMERALCYEFASATNYKEKDENGIESDGGGKIGGGDEDSATEARDADWNIDASDNDADDVSSIDDDVPLVELRKNKSKSQITASVARTKSTSTTPKKRRRRRIKRERNFDDDIAKELNVHNAKPSTASDPNKPKSEKFLQMQRNLEVLATFFQEGITCDVCKYVAPDYADLRKHFTVEHKRALYFRCCNKNYNKISKMVEHITWHQNPDEFKCKVCNKQLRNSKSLALHEHSFHQLVRKEKKSTHECPKCGKLYCSKQVLKNHIARHDTVQEQWPCEICEKNFVNQHRLRKHIESVHENLFPHICDICGKKFKFKPFFERHLLEHQGITEPPQQCQLCGQWLKNKHALRLHRFKHITENCECHICGHVCKSRTALRGHVGRHKLVMNLQCQFCDKIFKWKRNLDEHMAIHTGEQLYRCPHCPKESRSQSNMYVHIKRMHTDEWLKSKMARSNDPRFKATVEASVATESLSGGGPL